MSLERLNESCAFSETWPLIQTGGPTDAAALEVIKDLLEKHKPGLFRARPEDNLIELYELGRNQVGR